MVKTNEFKELYTNEISQHKSDVNILETEVQKLYEASSEVEIIKEKYNILKKEYVDLQQKFHLNVTIYEKQLEEFKKNYLIQEKEIEYLRKKDAEKSQQIEEYESNIESYITKVRILEEGKIELKSIIIKLTDEGKNEKIKLLHMKDLLKVCIKQLKNEFFQNIKKIHRAVFEEFMLFKKSLSECCQMLMSKLNTQLKSMISTFDIQKAQQKQFNEQYFRETEEYNALKLKISQYHRELCIRDDRILYLENSLKASIIRNKSTDNEMLRNLNSQIINLEDNYNQSYNEMVELIVILKTWIQKDFMSKANSRKDEN